MPRFRVIRLVVILLGLPSSAWAACGERDLQGTWDLQAESEGEMGNLTMTCEVALTGSGEIQPGTACTQMSAEGLVAEARVEGGKIALSRRCRATGQIVIGGFETTITKARMNGAKNQVLGAGKNLQDGAPVSFSATRRPVEVVETVEPKEPERRSERKGRWWRFW